MAKIEELQARVADAQARAEAANKAGDDAAEARAIDDEAAAQGELLEALALAAKLTGARMVRAHRAAAREGGYQIGAFDLRSKLPQLDASRFPNGGVVLFRSPDSPTRKRNEMETTEGSGVELDVALINLICACTIDPAPKPGNDAADIAYRNFWEREGRGLLTLAALEIQKLGGASLDALKRVSK